MDTVEITELKQKYTPSLRSYLLKGRKSILFSFYGVVVIIIIFFLGLGLVITRVKSQPEQVIASTFGSNTFTITYFTDWKSKSEVYVADNPEFTSALRFQDVRDYNKDGDEIERESRNSHIIVPTKLDPNKEYWYKVKTTFNTNVDEKYFRLTTPDVTDLVPPPYPIYGVIQNEKGKAMIDVVVDIYALSSDGKRSSTVTTYTSDNGTYSADLANLRSLDLKEYWEFKEEEDYNVVITARDSFNEYYYEVQDLSALNPVETIVLENSSDSYSHLSNKGDTLLDKLLPEVKAESHILKESLSYSNGCRKSQRGENGEWFKCIDNTGRAQICNEDGSMDVEQYRNTECMKEADLPVRVNAVESEESEIKENMEDIDLERVRYGEFILNTEEVSNTDEINIPISSNNLDGNSVENDQNANKDKVEFKNGTELQEGLYRGVGLLEGLEIKIVSPKKINFYEDMNSNYVKDEDEVLVVEDMKIIFEKLNSVLTYDISSGWNALNIPVKVDEEEVFSAKHIIDLSKRYGLDFITIKRWDGKWVEYTEKNGLTYGKDFNVKPNEGLFINSTTSGLLPIWGGIYDDEEKIRFENGWSLVGFSNIENIQHQSDDNGIGAFDLIKVINSKDEGIKLDNVTKWESGVYRGVNVSKGNDGREKEFGLDFIIDKREAYFVRGYKEVTLELY